MTDDELKAIEARAEAATPGPWTVQESGAYSFDGFYVQSPAPNYSAICGHTEREDDAAFIAHARTDVPALVAEVRRLRYVAVTALSTLDLIASGVCRHAKASPTECEDLARATLDRLSKVDTR